MDDICRYEYFLEALASDTRQKLLQLLQQGGEMTVGEIVERSDVTQPTISHHLGVLKRVGLVVSRRAGKRVYYSANQCCLEECCQRLFEQLGVTLALTSS